MSWIKTIFEFAAKVTLVSVALYIGYIYIQADVMIGSNKNTNENINNAIININHGHAIVSPRFDDAMRACWYYHGNYKHLHPYVLSWESSNKESFLPMRIVAEEAYWSGNDCIDEGLSIKLIGREETHHRIEANLTEAGKRDDKFTHIANAVGYYRSELSFDREGRIIERKVLGDEFQCQIIGQSATDSFINEGTIHDCFIRNKREFRSVNYNDLVITPVALVEVKKDPAAWKNYVAALNKYIEKRKSIHKDLAKEGCGVVTIEPAPRKHSSGEKIASVKPSIGFLCFKDNPSSHVRFMVRGEKNE